MLAGIAPQMPSLQAKIVLLGADHLARDNCRLFILPEAVQLTELYGIAVRAGNSQFSLPSFQSFKLLYAMLLADLGFTDIATKYVER